MNEEIEISTDLYKKILTQLINSDGMEVKNQYLIEQKIYYIDNTELVENLEKHLMEHYYKRIFDSKGHVNTDELYENYTPLFINYDKFYNELERKYNPNTMMDEEEKPKSDGTLNKYF